MSHTINSPRLANHFYRRIAGTVLLSAVAALILPNSGSGWFAAASADDISQLPAAPGAKFSANVDGKPFVATWVGTTYTTIKGQETLNVTGHIGTGIDSQFINCNIVEPKVGSYVLGGHAMGTSCSYHGGGDVFNGHFHFESGSIEITELDAGKTVSGTFSGSGKNMSGNKTLAVTDGHFTKIPLGQQSRVP